MHDLTITFCVEDPRYRKRLSEYLAEGQREDIKVRSLGRPEDHAALSAGEKGEIILLEEAFLSSAECFPEGSVPVLFHEGTIPRAWEGRPAICKYQAIDQILREAAGFGAAKEGPDRIYAGEKRVVAVCSPDQYPMQALFTMALAARAAAEGPVLYLNFMDCPGFPGLFGREYGPDLADLAYYARKGPDRLGNRLSSLLYQEEGFDYVPPASNPENLRELEGEGLEVLLKLLQEQTPYRWIFLDLSAIPRGFRRLALGCRALLCPVGKGFLSECRRAQFEAYLGMGEEKPEAVFVPLDPVEGADRQALFAAVRAQEGFSASVEALFGERRDGLG